MGRTQRLDKNDAATHTLNAMGNLNRKSKPRIIGRRRRRLLAVLAMPALALLSGCGIQHSQTNKIFYKKIAAEGATTTQQRQVGNFSSVFIDGRGVVELVTGPSPRLELVGAPNQLSYINAAVSGNMLNISLTEKVKFKPEVIIRVIHPNLSGVTTNGLFSLRTARGALQVASPFTLNATGTGNYRLVLNADTVNATAKGVMDVQLLGVARTLVAEMDATGSFDSRNLLTENVTVTLRGAGDVDVYASGRLEANASGVGTISYRGNPAEVVRNTKGIGAIRAAR